METIVAEHLGLAPEQVVLTNGVDEAIHVLFETFLETAMNCCCPFPRTPCTRCTPRRRMRACVTVQAGRRSASFRSSGSLAAITPRTKIIAIANPNSPSGSVATREQILEIARRAPQAVVLVDEAYFHFYGETVIDLIGTIPNLVVARTFSKAYGLAGLRLGLARRSRRTDAVGSARAFAVQREFARARLPAGCA